MHPTLFSHIKELEPDPILGLAALVKKDLRPDVIDLTIGIYKDEEGKSLPMDVVSSVELALAEENISKVYLPIEGDEEYLNATGDLVMGEDLFGSLTPKLVKAQTVGGTSALSLLAHFFSKELTKRVWISDPTWPNHISIFKSHGFDVKIYPYYSMKENQLTIDLMMQALKMGQKNDIVLLQACCHNPTGKDPSKHEWEVLLNLIIEKQMIPIFDLAYQGFGQNLLVDTWAIRLFLSKKMPMAIAVSHSKTFGLYAERLGALFLLVDDTQVTKKVLDTIKSIIRVTYSNPPKHGSLIVKTILKDPNWKSMWEKEIETYQKRITKMREELFLQLKRKGLENSFSHLNQAYGMFSFMGLTPSQVNHLQVAKGIYMTGSGRINLTSLNEKNIDRVVQAIEEVKRASYA